MMLWDGVGWFGVWIEIEGEVVDGVKGHEGIWDGVTYGVVFGFVGFVGII